ncbi:Uncharacterized protein dnm_053600 [Desulfonema magnum]|uniref:Uncharacterized protein n=1 Tax=Desulfonema magnum TaxID=45655 RepID=A0A975GPY1_9BACT|nr:Uncharacterized protein dnm_053600 [Desulfonema magnum]
MSESSFSSFLINQNQQIKKVHSRLRRSGMSEASLCFHEDRPDAELRTFR